MSAFTPGPWQALDPDKVGDVAISYRHNGHDLVCAHVYDGPEFGSARANARLVAAAPDLLAALEFVSAYYSASLDFRPAYVRLVLAAIAKARGQS